MEILIKPHHFMDIIKLYGSGIEKFVPDINMKHDFYKIANMIIENPDIQLKLTIAGDDICLPCMKYNNICIDDLNSVNGFVKKDDYNKILDKRLISLYKLNKDIYSAIELCEIFYKNHEFIYQVWLEEDDEITKKRHFLFCQGAKKYIYKYYY